MVVALPEELLDTIQQQVALRQAQLHQLNLCYNACPSTRRIEHH